MLCGTYTCVILHLPVMISSQPGSENEHRSLQNTVLCALQCAEKQDPLGSYQPNRPNPCYSQMPNKLATQHSHPPSVPLMKPTSKVSSIERCSSILTSWGLFLSHFPNRQKKNIKYFCTASCSASFSAFLDLLTPTNFLLELLTLPESPCHPRCKGTA